LIYNRPSTTERVFETIRQTKPTKLLVVADGPRSDKADEAAKCTAARAIPERVDWPCDVLTNYAEANLGCRRRISSGLDWVFSQVEEAIILEDDCLPHPDFFSFCEELLGRYRHDERVMHINGSNFQPNRLKSPHSYYFSRYPHVWGWASWRRAWQFFDVHLRQWADARCRRRYLETFADSWERRFWKQKLNAVSAGLQDTWDYQWSFACISQRSFSPTPVVNLISNIGCGPEALHTENLSDLFANRATGELGFPLRHPNDVSTELSADEYVARNSYWRPDILRRIILRFTEMQKS